MRFIKIFCSLFVVLILCSAFSLKGNKTKAVYIVGVSASFTDSLIYFTDIQLLDSVKLDNNKLLPQRSHYSYQLKNYLEGQEGLVNRTCFVYLILINRNWKNGCQTESEVSKRTECIDSSGRSDPVSLYKTRRRINALVRMDLHVLTCRLIHTFV